MEERTRSGAPPDVRGNHALLRAVRNRAVASIGSPILVSEPPFAVATHDRTNVVRRIAHFVACRAIPYLQEDHAGRCPVDELVGCAAGGKADAHPWCQRRFTFIRDQCRRAVEDVDEFILLAVTMKEGRLTPWEQRRQVYAEILEAEPWA